MKREIRTESTKVVHPAKTRSTRALVLGNLPGLAWKHIQRKENLMPLVDLRYAVNLLAGHLCHRY